MNIPSALAANAADPRSQYAGLRRVAGTGFSNVHSPINQRNCSVSAARSAASFARAPGIEGRHLTRRILPRRFHADDPAREQRLD
jgi:hypothetical protein